MSDIVLTNEMQALTKGRQFDPLTGVIIHAGQDENGNDKTYKVGTTSGYVLEYDNPLATQETAYSVLAALKARKWRYQPFEASTAYTDPAVEIGDNVTVDGSPSVVMSYDINHSRLMAPTLKAPYDEEIDHEFKYEPKAVREFRRESASTRARLKIANDQILSEVTRASAAEGELGSKIDQRLDRITLSVSSGRGTSTFSLMDGTTTLDTKTLDLSVKSVNISGLLTASQIAAKSITADKIDITDLSAIGATIGGWEIASTYLAKETDTYRIRLNAFTTPNAANNAISVATRASTSDSWATQFSVTNGGAVTCKNISIQGGSISIGGNFSVDSNGNLTANTGMFRGNVSAANILSGTVGGVNHGTFGGGGITPSSLGTSQLTGGVNTSLGYANYSDDVFNNRTTADYINVLNAYANTYRITGASVTVNQHKHTVSVNGGTVSIGQPDWVGSGTTSFNIADTTYYQNGVSAARSEGYSSGYHNGSPNRVTGSTTIGGQTFYSVQKNDGQTVYVPG